MDARIEQALTVWPMMSNESRRRALAVQLGPDSWPVLLERTGEGWLAELVAEHEAANAPAIVQGGLALVSSEPLVATGWLVWREHLGRVYGRRAAQRLPSTVPPPEPVSMAPPAFRPAAVRPAIHRPALRADLTGLWIALGLLPLLLWIVSSLASTP
jgi:hypothetical protein